MLVAACVCLCVSALVQMSVQIQKPVPKTFRSNLALSSGGVKSELGPT